ncbi:MAG: hypothetical protein R3E44_05550 [Paracoccaceae bacterium]
MTDEKARKRSALARHFLGAKIAQTPIEGIFLLWPHAGETVDDGYCELHFSDLSVSGPSRSNLSVAGGGKKAHPRCFGEILASVERRNPLNAQQSAAGRPLCADW